MSDFALNKTNQFGVDGFFRKRVSSPETIFDSKQVVDYSSYVWSDVQVSGSGTGSSYSANRASTSLSVSNTTAGVRVRQTKSNFNYQPGKSQLILTTFVMGAAATGITREVGLFNDQNGLFLRQTSSGVSVVVRSFVSGAAVDTATVQARWSEDPLDGTGPSGITLDLSKVQIFFVDFEWLGVGTVRFGFVIDGVPIYIHHAQQANLGASVYMSTPNLPVRFRLENGGTGAAATFETVCATVMSEGGAKSIGIPFCAHRGATPLTTNSDTNLYPLVAIRYRSGVNAERTEVIPKSISIITTSTSAFRWVLLKNPTITGTAFSWSTISPAIEAATTMTNATTVSGGIDIISGYSFQTNEGGSIPIELPRDERLGVTYAGVSDFYVLAIQKVTGTLEPFYASINWTEIT